VVFLLWDASALVKRYIVEQGSAVVDHTFAGDGEGRSSSLYQSIGEIISVLVRRKNAGDLIPARFAQAMGDLRVDLIQAVEFEKLEATRAQIVASWDLVETHSINSTDAIVLQVALDRANELRAGGSSLVLVASDERLRRAAGDEGLPAFNPETDSQADLEALL